MAVYFSIFLVIITVLTGIVWLANKYYLAPQRQLKLIDAQAQCEDELPESVKNQILEPSGVVDTSVQIFPVIAFVLILRSFLYEPFQIPSGSMMPTLLDGDFILVNKFNYGLRDPVVRHKFYENGLPERGDVVVFKYPLNTEVDYIKRVIGLPGDRIIYRDKSVYIKPACTEADATCPTLEKVITEFVNKDEYRSGPNELYRYTSKMPNKTHDILIDHAVPAKQQASAFCMHSGANLCQQAGTARDEYLVPAGHYFVMGDNRDNSLDGRFWGFVPEENLVGEAVAIWMSFDFDNTADDILPSWIPTNVRFSRIGSIQ
ncbi:MAG: signal peptidase I [Thalassotalea sp.]